MAIYNIYIYKYISLNSYIQSKYSFIIGTLYTRVDYCIRIQRVGIHNGFGHKLLLLCIINGICEIIKLIENIIAFEE